MAELPVMRSQDPFKDALYRAPLGFDNYKDYFEF